MNEHALTVKLRCIKVVLKYTSKKSNSKRTGKYLHLIDILPLFFLSIIKHEFITMNEPTFIVKVCPIKVACTMSCM